MWTSGRKCNFLNKGCDAAALQPVNINGWFWADGNKRWGPWCGGQWSHFTVIF